MFSREFSGVKMRKINAVNNRLMIRKERVSQWFPTFPFNHLFTEPSVYYLVSNLFQNVRKTYMYVIG